MSLDKKEVYELAGLARLELSEDQATAMVSELSQILTVFQSLDDIEVASLAGNDAQVATAMMLREDRVQASLATDRFESNAPQWDDDMFVVPKIVSKDS